MASTLGVQEKDLQGKEQKKMSVVYIEEHKFSTRRRVNKTFAIAVISEL
jgi:hypothetical protein